MNYMYFKTKGKEVIFNHSMIWLIVIGITGLVIRLFYLELDLPITLDGLGYFVYAFDITRIGHLPENYTPSNNGWPIFLSLFFSLSPFEKAIEFMQLQKFISILLSTLTIIPVYFLCRKFFQKSFSLIGALIFALEPRIIQNSLFGITEPLYIFLVVTSMVLFLSSKKFVFISFAVASLATITRSEGIFLFFSLSILFFIKYRQDKVKTLIKYFIILSIFALILLPIAIYKTDIHGEDRMFSRVNSGLEYQLQENSVLIGISNFIKFLGWSTIPLFIIFVPLGYILIFKEFNFKKLVLIITTISLSMPALYAYSIPALDVRFLYSIYPIFCVVSLFSIKFFDKKISKQKILIVLIIIGIISSSIFFLEIKKSDHEYDLNSFIFAVNISEEITGINQYYPEDQYLSAAIVIKDWPNLNVSDRYGNIKTDFKIFQTNDYDSLEQFIRLNKDNGLSHLVIVDNNYLPTFLKIDENEYSFLEKIEIKNNLKNNFNHKLYKINYEKFFKNLGKNNLNIIN